MGNIIKTLTVFNKPFWRDSNYNGLSLAYDPSFGVKLTYDASIEYETMDEKSRNEYKKNSNIYALVGFFAGDAGVEWGKKSEKREENMHWTVFQSFSKRKNLKCNLLTIVSFLKMKITHQVFS